MIYCAKESTSKRGLACADTCTFIYNRKIAIAWKKINEQREYNEKQQHKLHNNLKALKTVVHRPPPCVLLLLLLLHTSIQNRSSISIHVIPKHTYTLIYHYQHNKFYELFVEMASTFLAPKIIFCSQTSRHGVIIIIIISHTMSMKWTLWKFYVADTIRYDTDMYYSHLNIDICQAIRQFCHLHCTYTEAGRMIITFLFRILLLLPRLFHCFISFRFALFSMQKVECDFSMLLRS